MTDDGRRRLSWPECPDRPPTRCASCAHAWTLRRSATLWLAWPPVKGLRGADPDKVGGIAEQFAAAEALVATREAAVPTITYPGLPVSVRCSASTRTGRPRRPHVVGVIAGTVDV
jgi:hypothetical protein